MGWRFRKSINLGGGFRINLSKSGIGYSWGIPGYRITKTATGKIRKTYSIPGTGLHYVDEVSDKNSQSPDSPLITGDTTYFQNTNLEKMREQDEILEQINKTAKLNSNSNLLITTSIIMFSIIAILSNSTLQNQSILLKSLIFFGISFICIGLFLKLLIKYCGKINLEYTFDEFNKEKYEHLKNFILEIFRNNKNVWQIHSSTKVYNTKYNAGASNNISRNTAFITKKMPWYIKTNIEVFCLNLKNEKIYFTPDRMIIFNNISGVSGSSYRDLNAFLSDCNFIEENRPPKDSKIVSYTWKYVNKNGEPDRRFSNNKRYSVCKYGTISLSNDNGINILLYCSNINSITTIQSELKKFAKLFNQEISNSNEKNNDKIESQNNESYNANSNTENIKNNNILFKILNILKAICCTFLSICLFLFAFVSLAMGHILNGIIWGFIALTFFPGTGKKVKTILRINNLMIIILIIFASYIYIITVPSIYETTWKTSTNESIILKDNEATIIFEDGTTLYGTYIADPFFSSDSTKITVTITSEGEHLNEELIYIFQSSNNIIKFYSVQNDLPDKYFIPENMDSLYEYVTE